MKTALAFWLTEHERQAFVALVLCPASWPTFAPRTWKSLASKGLVNFAQARAGKSRPVVRPAAEKSLTSFLRTLTSIPAGSEGS